MIECVATASDETTRLATPLRLDFLTFLPHYFRRLDLLTWSHLWFLAYLFVISLLLLPLLAWLAAREPSAAVPHPAWAYAPALPSVLVLVGCSQPPTSSTSTTSVPSTIGFCVSL